MSAETAPQPRPGEPYGLTDRDRAMLTFEGRWWHHKGAKEETIRREFDMSATRYYQVLGALIQRPEALAAESMIVNRLRRLRAARRAARP